MNINIFDWDVDGDRNWNYNCISGWTDAEFTRVYSGLWLRHYLQQIPGPGGLFYLATEAQSGARLALSFPGQTMWLILFALHSLTRTKAACVSQIHIHRGHTYVEHTCTNCCTWCCLLASANDTSRIHIKLKYRQASPIPPQQLPRLKLTRENTCSHSVDLQAPPHSQIPQTSVWALCLSNSPDSGFSHLLST